MNSHSLYLLFSLKEWTPSCFDLLTTPIMAPPPSTSPVPPEVLAGPVPEVEPPLVVPSAPLCCPALVGVEVPPSPPALPPPVSGVPGVPSPVLAAGRLTSVRCAIFHAPSGVIGSL